ncbi:MAG: hypothetical protein IT489_06640 [Gammaproteobacteria bacterium]|nr:hypothetical protein [Gammaproteobacteria bacterium]
MKSRIDEVPKLKTQPAVVDGRRYNQVLLGLRRLKGPLRLPLAGLRGMDLLVDKEAWVCVDRTLYDLPVIAWTDFRPTARRAIHEIVPCLLHYYHINAELIGESVLATAMKEIQKRLANRTPVSSSRISAFRPDPAP